MFIGGRLPPPAGAAKFPGTAKLLPGAAKFPPGAVKLPGAAKLLLGMAKLLPGAAKLPVGQPLGGPPEGIWLFAADAAPDICGGANGGI